MKFDHIKNIDGFGEVGIFVIGTRGPYADGKKHPRCNLHAKDTGKLLAHDVTIMWDEGRLMNSTVNRYKLSLLELIAEITIQHGIQNKYTLRKDFLSFAHLKMKKYGVNDTGDDLVRMGEMINSRFDRMENRRL